MSGIVGMLNLDGGRVDRPLLEDLTELLAFRGPDAKGLWAEGPVGLGHALLRTRDDGTQGPQPAPLDGVLRITCDARLDDREGLTSKLEARGQRGLEPASDAELILHAYRVWGEQCAEHLFGAFAFALWDQERGQLLCARDRFGIKPFYYTLAGSTYVFSNTLDCLRMHPRVPTELNELAIADFLMTGVNQEPETTSFRWIQRVPPATVLVVSSRSGRMKPHRYWQLAPVETIRYRKQADYVTHFRELFSRSVADRLRTDRVGVLMSGGLDSTSVAVTAHELLSQRDASFDLQALTFVYHRLIPDEEGDYSRLVAESKGFGVRHFVGDDYELYEKGSGTRYRPPEPTDAPLASSFFERFSPENDYPRVVLTGQGGDPALLPSAAYFFRLAKRFRCLQILKDLAQYIVTYHAVPPLYIRQRLRAQRSGEPPPLPPWLSRELSSRLSLGDRWAELARRKGSYASYPRPEAHENLSLPLWASLFECYDAGATGFLTELRHPFFDLRLMSFLLALPSVPWCVDKNILRESMRGSLPEPVRCRRKTPLAAFPEYEKIRRSSAEVIDTLAATRGLGQFVAVERFLKIAKRPERLRPSEVTLITRPLSLAVWLRQLENRRSILKVREKHEVQG